MHTPACSGIRIGLSRAYRAEVHRFLHASSRSDGRMIRNCYWRNFDISLLVFIYSAHFYESTFTLSTMPVVRSLLRWKRKEACRYLVCWMLLFALTHVSCLDAYPDRPRTHLLAVSWNDRHPSDLSTVSPSKLFLSGFNRPEMRP